MYVGDTNDATGLHHLVWEILANSIDESIAGHCNEVTVQLHSDGSISIRDDGRGIPVHDVRGVPFVELITTQLHTDASKDGHSPHVHIALSGIGIAPVSALSNWFELETHREGRIYALRTERGVLVQKLQDVGPTSDSGTSIRLLPDSEIFRTTQFSYALIEARIKELVAMTPGLRITLTAEGRSKTFHAPEGLHSLLDGESEILSAKGQHGRFSFELVWNREASEHRIDAFTNWQRVGTKGSHVQGLLAGLGVEPEAIQQGTKSLHAVLHIHTTDLSMIYGPTRSELRDDELEVAIMKAVQESIARKE